MKHVKPWKIPETNHKVYKEHLYNLVRCLIFIKGGKKEAAQWLLKKIKEEDDERHKLNIKFFEELKDENRKRNLD